MPTLLRLILLSVAFAVATVAIGWWGVPLAAAIYGVISRQQRSSAIVAGIAGVLAWSELLLFDAARGPIGVLAQTLGGVLNAKPIAVYVLTLAFPGLLALTASLLARQAASIPYFARSEGP